MPETPLSSMAVYSARPAVQVDAQQQPKVSELVVAMTLTEREGGLSALELRVSNVASEPGGSADLAFEDNAILRLGARLTIYAGDETSPQEIFRGVVTGLEAEFPEDQPPELVVLAEDVFQQARLSRRTKIHEDVTLADLVNELASQLSLTPVVSGFSDNIDTQVQLNESDLAFVRRLLIRYDGDMQVVGNELHVAPRGEVQRGTLELQLHGQLRRARVLADLAHQVTEVTVSGWDGLRGTRIAGTSSGANLGPGQGQTGSELLRSAIGQRSHHVGHLAVTTEEEARAVADAAYDCRARRFVCVEGTAVGNPALRVGTHLTLGGMGPRFDNTYYVVRACHRWDVTRGYETDFEAESAYWGGG